MAINISNESLLTTPFQSKYLVDDSENSSNDTDEVIFQGNVSTTSPSLQVTTDRPSPSLAKERGNNSCRALQKKLEMKVERAKRNYRQLHQIDDTENWDVCIAQPKSTNLIPINRLQYPGRPEQHTLIEYREVNNVEDDLGTEEAKFFASKHKKVIKQDLSDTFSIQEMTIESDSESEFDTLELLPLQDAQYWERVAGWLPCCTSKDM